MYNPKQTNTHTHTVLCLQTHKQKKRFGLISDIFETKAKGAMSWLLYGLEVVDDD